VPGAHLFSSQDCVHWGYTARKPPK
jgi:hypothetical protein